MLLASLAAPGCESTSIAPVPQPGSEQAAPSEDLHVAQAAPTVAPVPVSATPGLAAPAPAPQTPTAGIVSASSTRYRRDSATLREVRVGQHANTDRIVFEFEGNGLPAWTLEYVDQPVRDCGTGDPVPVAGDGWLQVSFTGAQAHTETGEPTSAPRRRSVDQPVVLELVRTCDFEGHVTWVAGVSSPNRFSRRVLSNPSRLVIDVSH